MVDLNYSSGDIVVINIVICILLGLTGNSIGKIILLLLRSYGWMYV